MIEKTIKYNGILTHWSLSDNSDRQILKVGFEDLGLAELIPSPKNDTQALLRALNKVFSKQDVVIKTVRGTSGYKVCGRQDLGGKTRYTEALKVTFDSSGYLQYEENEVDTSVRFESWVRFQLESEFNVQKKLVSGAVLGTVLSNAARKLGGISMRPRGGFYWIPKTSKARWKEIAGVISLAFHKNTVSCIQTTTDSDTLDAICVALVSQVESKLGQLETSMEEGELGKRALQTREREAQELDSLVQNYEGILGKTLTSLRDRAEEVESSASLAILEAMAST
tara:strand:+ start:5488 stop:6333 length:846 start_codon:yes stop_codon:yes gene_type:complete